MLGLIKDLALIIESVFQAFVWLITLIGSGVALFYQKPSSASHEGTYTDPRPQNTPSAPAMPKTQGRSSSNKVVLDL